MAVYKDSKRSTYYVNIFVVDPLTNKKKKITKRGFKTKKEAQKWEAEIRLEQQTVGTSLTFWDVFQMYLNDNDTIGETRTKKESWITKYFCEYKDVAIEKITRPQLIKWRSDLKNKGIATRTMNTGLQYVRSVFTFYSTVYGGQNPALVLKAYRMPRDEKKEMEIWTVEEFNQFLAAVDNPVLKAYFSFLYWTGCRRGEGIAVCKQDVVGNTVHITKSMKHYSGGFRPLKTDSSERVIVMDDALVEMLTPLLETADPFVFGGETSIGTNTIDRAFKKAIEESGVKPIRIHDLRHSHASLLLNNGVNIVAVSKRLGHATVSQTLETYTHLMQETDDKMMQKIADLKRKK